MREDYRQPNFCVFCADFIRVLQTRLFNNPWNIKKVFEMSVEDSVRQQTRGMFSQAGTIECFEISAMRKKPHPLLI
jgi:hypothetical protein